MFRPRSTRRVGLSKFNAVRTPVSMTATLNSAVLKTELMDVSYSLLDALSLR